MEDFRVHFRKLDEECSYYCRHLGVVKGLLNNGNVKRVLDGSFAGYPVAVGHSEIRKALVLFICRIWDKAPDVHSIDKLSRCLPDIETLVAHHEKIRVDSGRPYCSKKLKDVRSRFVEKKRALAKLEVLQKLQNLRTSEIAHNLQTSKYDNPAQVSDLVAVAEGSMELVDLAGYMIERASGAYTQFTEISERQTIELFRIMPELCSIEEL